MLALAFLLGGCSGHSSQEDEEKTEDEFLLVKSTPVDGAQEVSVSLTEVILEFNQEVADAQVVLKANGREETGIEVNKDNKKVIVSGVELEKDMLCSLNYTAKNNQQDSLTGKIEFRTVFSQLSIPDGMINPTIMQTFYWDMYDGAGDLWVELQNKADELAEVGITSLWLPPANKGMSGTYDVGYGNYDMWDLGEFYQHGTEEIKYGTKAQLEAAVDAIHNAGMKAYYDVVFNHRMGADGTEMVTLSDNSPDKAEETIEAWTEFNLAGRQEYYTQDKWSNLWHDFNWNWKCFDAVDYDNSTEANGKFLFKGKTWGWTPDAGDADYLMGADVDYYNYDSDGTPNPNTQVIDEMKAWGRWIVNDIGFDGFRIDAVKHVDSTFINQWIYYVEQQTDKDVFFVGEAWEGNTGSLKDYLDMVDGRSSYLQEAGEREDTANSQLKVFDFPLREYFKGLRDGSGSFDMADLKEAGLVNSEYSNRTVAFVDNHDTERTEYGSGPIDHYKYQAYAYILMRKEIPVVFWKDYYTWGMKDRLDELITARYRYAYGAAHEVNNNDNDVYSYVRAGLADHPQTGLVLMISDGKSGDTAVKTINSRQPNTTFYDFTGNVSGTVTTDGDGYGEFKVKKSEDTGWSVWIPAK